MSQTNFSGDGPFIERELGEFQTLVDIVKRLRSPDGCPWDLEQTHESLKRNLLEESYEVLEAIDKGDNWVLAEELGDILGQVAFHADIASEAGEFELSDILTQINDKLVRRHPHVFSGVVVRDAREVERNWDRLKAEDRGRQGASKSPVEGIPGDLPALAYAQLMQDRVGRAGFEWNDISGVLDKIVEEVEEYRKAETEEQRIHEIGDLLFTMVNFARWTGLHAEDVLRRANQRFRSRYLVMERLAEERELDFTALPLSEKEGLWQEAKRRESI